jgi:transcriptional regulator with XRE-family HTH domain
VPTRERLASIGTARGRQLVREFADELRHARLAAGLTQATLGAAAGVSKASISRIELGQQPFPDFMIAARVARLVGLELSVRCFPAPGQLRDAAHIALTQKLLARLPPDSAAQPEAPVRPGDLRAWDLLLLIGAIRIGVLAETRLRDIQALLRRERQKQTDGNVDRLLLLVARTRHNSRSIDEAGAILRAAFPLNTRITLGYLSRGAAPPDDGIVVL